MKWSHTSIVTLRMCKRKFYFSQVLSETGHPINLRSQAKWLKKAMNLEMWAGHVVDTVINTQVVPLLSLEEIPDFKKVEEYAIELARRQFLFSKKKRYREIHQKEAGEEYCILDFHEFDLSVKEEDILKAVERIKIAIRNIPVIRFEDGTNLLELLLEASPNNKTEKFPKRIRANIQNRHLKVGEADVNPQIDLLLKHGTQQVVIDWKVSDSDMSDYSRQLGIIGTVIYRHRVEQFQKDDSWMYQKSQIRLLEVNLLRCYIKEHLFNDDTYSHMVDYISQTACDLDNIKRGRSWNSIPMKEYPRVVSDACDRCNFYHLCNFLRLYPNEFTISGYREFVRIAQSD
ncbi:PD-(D/E)XK nuclease family protein [Runella aurantiaca]|uniref:PD-(D/E)XK endonuclease-like domain-containing protein n=1 Tax=Runella aurantiaca TaxID=2282308 RepID=A0A369IDP5_9BACT|nr:PD-(D/E)XK nuclease family protein [Runella aurantiaca]RDB07798.1 hypothetical protein DVG78_01715 [Runella aurantiaca]